LLLNYVSSIGYNNLSDVGPVSGSAVIAVLTAVFNQKIIGSHGLARADIAIDYVSGAAAECKRRGLPKAVVF